MNIHRTEKVNILKELLEEVIAEDISTENLSLLEKWLRNNIEGMSHNEPTTVLLFKENKKEVTELALDA